MFISNQRSRLAGLLLLGAIAGPAPAQPTLDLAAVLDFTLRHHPVVARIEAETRRLKPAAELARQSPPIQLGVETENIGENTGDRLQSTLSLSGVLEWGGQPNARVELASAETAASLRELAQQRTDLLAHVASRFIALAGAQQALDQSAAVLALARKTQEATRRRQQAGAASQADVQRAELTLAEADLGRVEAERAVAFARSVLRLATGAAELPDAPVTAALDQLPDLPRREVLLSEADQAPALQLAQARLLIARSQLELARLQNRPALGWQLGIRDERELDTQSVVLGFSLPLGQERRSRPLTARALAAADVAEQDKDIARLELQALLLDTWQSLDAGQRRVTALDERMIPKAEAIVRSLRAGYEQGRYSLLELSSAEQNLNSLREQRLAARIRFHQSWIGLERLLGRPLIRLNSGDRS